MFINNKFKCGDFVNLKVCPTTDDETDSGMISEIILGFDNQINYFVTWQSGTTSRCQQGELRFVSTYEQDACVSENSDG